MLYIFPKSWGKGKEENASEALHGLQSLNIYCPTLYRKSARQSHGLKQPMVARTVNTNKMTEPKGQEHLKYDYFTLMLQAF